MTSTPVNVQGFVSNTLYGTGRMQGNEGKGDFSKIFESQKDSVQEVQETDLADKDLPEETSVKEVKNNEDVDVDVNNVEAQKESTTVQESSEAQSTDDEAGEDLEDTELSAETMIQIAEVLQSAVADVKEFLAQELNISEEELNAFMQDLNLTDADLLQLENVKKLVLEVSGAQDTTALLTDENLYSLMKNVENDFGQIMKDVQDTLQMDQKDLAVAVEQLDENLHTKTQEPKIVLETEDALQMKDTGIKEVDEQSAPKGEQNPTQGDGTQTFTPQQVPMQQENVQSVSTPVTSYTAADAQNIMNQIMDFMKIQLNAESTELDMQLHPESLGTLQIRISAKEGIMTTQFTTASETVKSVLEGQMIQLQQQFEQQNIKVDAIEVTVQTHSFESALEQGNERQTNTEDSKRNRTRRIDLSRLDDSEGIDEEDRVVAEMMAASGNSVDYLA